MLNFMNGKFLGEYYAKIHRRVLKAFPVPPLNDYWVALNLRSPSALPPK